MTLDTATLRAQAMDDIDNMRDLTGRSDLGPREVVALLDALDAERERVRVLREALEGVRPCLMDAMRYGGGRYGKEHAAMDAALGAEMDREEAALATAGGKGATTP